MPEYVADEAVALAPAKPFLLTPGHDARGILAAMLQDSQRIVDGLVDRLLTNDTDDATHCSNAYL